MSVTGWTWYLRPIANMSPIRSPYSSFATSLARNLVANSETSTRNAAESIVPEVGVESLEVRDHVIGRAHREVLRHRNHYFMAQGIHASGVEDEFFEHATDEQDHADRVAKRITELGGTPNLNPEGLAIRSHAEYGTGKQLEEVIEEDLIAERIAVQTYADIVRWLGTDDPATRRMMEELLAKEEEHADNMAKLLSRVSK